MATVANPSSHAWINPQLQQNHGEIICSSRRSSTKSSLCSFMRFQRGRFHHGLRGKMRKEMRRPMVKVKINDCCCCCGKFNDIIPEEDSRFVEVLREAQSYIYLHRGNTFVLVLSPQIVATPYLDTILKVSLFSLLFV